MLAQLPDWCSALHSKPCPGACCRFDAPRFFAECRRVLKPTGALAVFSYIPLQIHFPGSAAASEVLQRRVCGLLRLRGFDSSRLQAGIIRAWRWRTTGGDSHVAASAASHLCDSCAHHIHASLSFQQLPPSAALAAAP